MRICIAALLVAACSTPHALGDAGAPVPDGGSGSGTITATPVGTPIGAPVTATVDPDGGRVTSSDGVLELDFPAGAVATPTDVTLTPIIDHAPLGVAAAYRIDAAGFAAPATAIFRVAPSVAHAGDTGTLFVAAQDAQGVWVAQGAASWDEAAGTATATAAIAHPGDVALGACVLLVTDEDLALGGAAQLRVQRQCDVAPASGEVGAIADVTDPVDWANHDPSGGAGLGTLTPSGATATLAPPAQPPAGSPITVVTASVASATVAPSAAPRTIPLQRSIAIASYATWTVDGHTFTGVLGSSVLSGQGKSTIAAGDIVNSGSLNVAFPSDTTGSFTATYVDTEMPGPETGIAYTSHYNDPCSSAFVELPTTVDVTNASVYHHAMSGRIEGQVATIRGTRQCTDGPHPDVAIVTITGVFNLMWTGPQ